METILQHPILTDFLYPFLLIFFLVFAILQKSKVLGDDKIQLNALVSLVIGLIFVSAVFPKIIVSNLMIFLAVALVVVFVGMMLWGFISGEGAIANKGMKIFLVILIFVAILLALLSITGIGGNLMGIFDFLFNSGWSGTFWTNFLFVVLIVGSVLVVIKTKPGA